jgi:hypothetical protein
MKLSLKFLFFFLYYYSVCQGQAPYKLELYRYNEKDSIEEVLPLGGGVVAFEDKFYLRLIRNKNVIIEKNYFFTLMDFQPDGIINQLTGTSRVRQTPFDCRVDQSSKDTINTMLSISFSPPYGFEEFLLLFTESPVDFEYELKNGNPGRNLGSMNLQVLKEIKKGNIPDELKGRVFTDLFSFSIRGNELINEVPNVTLNSTEINDINQAEFSNALDRGLVPNSQAYTEYPVLILHEPSESSLSTNDPTRGQKMTFKPLKFSTYVIKASVTSLLKVQNVSIFVRNHEKKFENTYNVENFILGPQSISFEKQIDLVEGKNEIVIVVQNESGNAVKEKFTIPYIPDDSLLKGRDLLVLMAVNDYSNWNKLKNPVSDAESLSEVLINHYSIETSNVVKLYNKDFTVKKVDSLFRKLTLSLNENDRVLVFYAGHGYYDSIMDEGYWIPFDGEKIESEGSYSGFISNSRIDKYIKALKTRHTLFITDACFSGSYFIENRGAYTTRVGNFRSRWLFSSGRMEEVADGYSNTGHSPFAYFLIDYLTNPTENKFTISEVANFVIKAVANNSKQLPQISPIKNSGDEGGEFVFEYK